MNFLRILGWIKLEFILYPRRNSCSLMVPAKNQKQHKQQQQQQQQQQQNAMSHHKRNTGFWV